MPRRQHYLTRNEGGATPSHLLVVDTETVTRQLDADTEEHELVFGYAVYSRRLKGGVWSSPTYHRFDNQAEALNIIEHYCRPKRRLYVLSHNAQFDVMALNAITGLLGLEFTLQHAVIESPPFSLLFKRYGASLQWLDTLNWFQMSLDALGRQVGLEKLDMPSIRADSKEADAYCRRDCEIVLRAYQQWLAFIKSRDLGNVAMSLASQAFNAYRHRFMRHKILIDTDPKALGLARQSYCGGRVECSFIGTRQNSYYYVDVNSMYPYVMREHLYPARLATYLKRISKHEVWEASRCYCVTVDATISTDEPVYALKRDGKLIFPVGRFRTALSTPEMNYAYLHGHLEDIHACAIYEADRLFREYVDYFYPLRQEARCRGDAVLAMQAKLMLNTLYGKFGQTGYIYQELERVDDWRIGQERFFDHDTGQWMMLRYLGNTVSVKQREQEANMSHPAICAHVTAYGRMYLWYLMQQAGRENVFYCDTDSLIVNRAGYRRLAAHLDADQLGALKLEAEANTLSMWGPKHYRLGELSKVKGVRKDAVWMSERKIRQAHWTTLKGAIREGRVDRPQIKRVTKKLSLEYSKGTVLPPGDVVPFKLP